VAQEVLLDQPAGRKQQVWDQDSTTQPFLNVTEKVGNTDYQVDLFVSDVKNVATGQILGTGPSGTENAKTRLKQVEAVIHWWDSEQTSHRGYGRLELRAARLLKVTREDP
jgi:hypothetical protein